STLERIKREGVLRWGADSSGGAPFAFNDPADPNKVIGFEVEIAAGLARRLGVRPELVKGDWEALIPSLNARPIDLAINGLEITPRRKERVHFSVPYFQYAQQLTVRAPDRERYRSLADLKGKVVSVLNGSASLDVLRREGWPDRDILQLDDSL